MGLIREGSPPRDLTASLMAAKSTTAGTPLYVDNQRETSKRGGGRGDRYIAGRGRERRREGAQSDSISECSDISLPETRAVESTLSIKEQSVLRSSPTCTRRAAL